MTEHFANAVPVPRGRCVVRVVMLMRRMGISSSSPSISDRATMVDMDRACAMVESLNSDSCPSLATLHGGAFAAMTVHVARNSVTTVHGGKFSLAPVQPGASDI